jgi:hypothetical protein
MAQKARATATETIQAFTTWWLSLSPAGKRVARQQLRCEPTSMRRWFDGTARPSFHHRLILETLSGGRVRAEDWVLPSERRLIAAACCIDHEIAHTTKLQSTGTDGG